MANQTPRYRYLHSDASLLPNSDQYLIELSLDSRIPMIVQSEINAYLGRVQPSPTMEDFRKFVKELDANNDAKAVELAAVNNAKAVELAAVNNAKFASLEASIASLEASIASLEASRDASAFLHLEVTLPHALATVFRIFSDCALRALEIRHLEESIWDMEARITKWEKALGNSSVKGREQARRSAGWKVLDQIKGASDTMSQVEFLKMASAGNDAFLPFRVASSQRAPDWVLELHDKLIGAQVLSPEVSLLLEYLVQTFPESKRARNEAAHVKSFRDCLRIIQLYREAKLNNPDLVIHHELSIFEQMAQILGGESWYSVSADDPLGAVLLSNPMAPELPHALVAAAVEEED